MKQLILITNDDGIYSPGLKAAAEAVRELGDLMIAAPRHQQTSMSRAFPKADDLGVIEIVELEISHAKRTAYAIHGSPAFAVSHAVLELCDRRPALCISGINYGENLGLSVFPSGTIGAALEADTYDIPALAVSLEASIDMQHSSEYNPLDWEVAKYFTAHFAANILRDGLPRRTALLNVNIPRTAKPDTEIRITHQSRQNYFVFRKPEPRDFSKSFRLRVETEVDYETLESDSDIKAFVVDRVVSVTPLTWDLTTKT
jgi:5'-nucleotidase